MRQHIVKYECDSCHKVVEEPQHTTVPRGRLPKDWLHVDGLSNGQSAFRLDLCETCKLDIVKYTQNAPSAERTGQGKCLS